MKPAQLNSGVVVRAWMMPPASRMRSPIGVVSSATASLNASDAMVAGSPSISTSSLRPIGNPSSGRASSGLRAYTASAAFACASARS